jgi:hypothetical protein
MGGLAYSIKRTRVGDMSCKMPLRSWEAS